MLVPITIPPGVFYRGTEEQSAGRFRLASNVRWYGPALGMIGGSRKRGTAQATGKVRSILPWRDNAGNRWVALGSHSNIYAMNAALGLVDLTPVGFVAGRADAGVRTGYGYGAYGSGTYGTPRTDTGLTNAATVVLMDVWGQFLVFCSADDGKLYEWRLDPAVKPAVIVNAPTGCRGVLVTDERFMFALGAGGEGRKVQWPDRENNTVWTPAATNQAGDYLLNSDGTIQTAARLRGELLILTDQDAHQAAYQGPPLVYGFQRVGSGCGAISQGALVTTGTTAFWMSDSGFWTYDGGLFPLDCDVHDFVFGDMNGAQKTKVSGWHNAQHGEVWWHFPSAASIENDRYCFYSYRHGWWGTGQMARLCGAEPGIFATPLLVDADGFTYEHEVQGTAPDSPYASSGLVALGDGEGVNMIRKLYLDETGTPGSAIQLGARTTRRGTPATTTGTGPDFNTRLSGRFVDVRIVPAAPDTRVGLMRADVASTGARR